MCAYFDLFSYIKDDRTFPAWPLLLCYRPLGYNERNSLLQGSKITKSNIVYYLYYLVGPLDSTMLFHSQPIKHEPHQFSSSDADGKHNSNCPVSSQRFTKSVL